MDKPLFFGKSQIELVYKALCDLDNHHNLDTFRTQILDGLKPFEATEKMLNGIKVGEAIFTGNWEGIDLKARHPEFEALGRSVMHLGQPEQPVILDCNGENGQVYITSFIDFAYVKGGKPRLIEVKTTGRSDYHYEFSNSPQWSIYLHGMPGAENIEYWVQYYEALPPSEGFAELAKIYPGYELTESDVLQIEAYESIYAKRIKEAGGMEGFKAPRGGVTLEQVRALYVTVPRPPDVFSFDRCSALPREVITNLAQELAGIIREYPELEARFSAPRLQGDRFYELIHAGMVD